MSRPAKGQEVLEKAKAFLAEAKTVEELRQAQAVVLPLEFGLSLRQTAEAIGKSPRWTSKLREEFIRRGGSHPVDKPTRGGRRRQNMTPEEESDFLSPFLEEAEAGRLLGVGHIKEMLEARLGRRVALASVYNLLHRYGWRKHGSDNQGTVTDEAAQAEAGKNSSKSRAPER